MNKIIKRSVKFTVFILILAVLVYCTALILRDDAHSYSRVMMHELYNQDHIDYVVCGASHVSHGLDPKLVEQFWGKSLYNTGTPSQHIDGSYAMLRQVLDLYKVEKVFLDIDNGIAASTPFLQRKGFKSEYIVSTYLRDPKIKLDFYKNMSSPEYYLNSILPLGKDKLITLDPIILFDKAKQILNGKYFNYEYSGWNMYKINDDSIYKGCVYEDTFIEEGSFHETANVPIIMKNVKAGDWDATIDKIIALCKEKNVELIFFSVPCSDFYLKGKGNYDEYYVYARDFLKERGYEYYDFNLIKENILSFADTEFRDSNHLNHTGIKKFTKVFCDFFDGKYEGMEVFYNSHEEKINSMEPRIFGVDASIDELKQNLILCPITNNVSSDRITFDVTAVTGGKSVILAEKTFLTRIPLPPASSDVVKVQAYLDGSPSNSFSLKYLSF